MKLTSTQANRALKPIGAEPLPDDHPVIPRLTNLFGEHTFFLDSNGLNIVEPSAIGSSGANTGKVVNLANWTEPDSDSLVVHEPETTEIVVVIEPER
jgi:hypothetical protein